MLWPYRNNEREQTYQLLTNAASLDKTHVEHHGREVSLVGSKKERNQLDMGLYITTICNESLIIHYKVVRYKTVFIFLWSLVNM